MISKGARGVSSGVKSVKNHRFEIHPFLSDSCCAELASGGLVRSIAVVAKALRISISVAELGREPIPCKDWPSATASGGCGLDKELPPDPVCHQKIDGEIRAQISAEEPAQAVNFRPLAFD